MTRRAIEQGLLPPLRTSGLVCADIFGASVVGKRANDLHNEQQDKIAKVAAARVAAAKALLDYADALEAIEEDNDILTVAASTQHSEMHVCEISKTHVRAIAEQISKHAEYRLG